jgi:hypothetical protein
MSQAQTNFKIRRTMSQQVLQEPSINNKNDSIFLESIKTMSDRGKEEMPEGMNKIN